MIHDEDLLEQLDFSDAWLLRFELENNKIRLTLEARNILSSDRSGSRAYEIVSLTAMAVRRFSMSLSISIMSDREDDICDMHSLVVSAEGSTAKVEIELEYGKVSFVADRIFLQRA